MKEYQSELPTADLPSPGSSGLSLRMMTRMMIFFSEIATSATHDMKNFLAIINENAGLLEDLAQGDHPPGLDPERVKGVTGKMKSQIQRTDHVLKKLNRFSRDLAPVSAVIDLETTLCLVIDLSAGIIRNHAAQVKVISPNTRVYVDSPPFLLNLLIFRAIQTCLGAADGNKEVVISFENHKNLTGLRFFVNQIKPDGIDPLFSSHQEEEELTTYLSININRDIKNGFILEWKK